MGLLRILLVSLLLTTPTWAGEGKTFVPPGGKVLEGLGIEATECAAKERARYAEHVAVVCGTTDMPFKSLKKTWATAARRGALGELIRWDGDPWRGTAGDRKTMYAQAAGLPLAVTFDPATGATAVRWPESYPGCHRGFEFAWYTASTDIIAPEATNRVHPDYPEEARVQRTGGSVIGSFLVDARGDVVDVCVVAAHPPRLGFEQAAIDAYMRSSFAPATRHGEPLAVAAAVSTEFHVNGGTTFSSVLARAWFESVETVADYSSVTPASDRPAQ